MKKSTIPIIPFIDLTSLNTNDNEETITHLCQKAITPFGAVAAVCIYPKFVNLASKLLKNTSVKIATVVNFPSGEQPLFDVLQEVEASLNQGANEVDMVLPYQLYLQGEKNKALDYVIKVRKVCESNIKLKVIIETGALKTTTLIQQITNDVILAGADFVKTSTGKTPQGATIDAVKVMLTTIKEQTSSNQKPIGLKVSGGIRTVNQAQAYLNLAIQIMGKNWLEPTVFRIGASKLLDEIIDTL